jgi:uncharacterized surface protein with fasciclin (FAS1) repeats
MKKSILIVVLSLTGVITINHVSAQIRDTTKKTTTTTTTTTAPAPVPTVDVATVLSGNPDYTTAATAVKTANLESTLKTGGPYTIFAPNNAAFSNLPAGKLDSLMKDPVKLATLLKGHIVSGQYTKADIIKALTTGNGKATLTTLNRQTLNLSISPKRTLLLTNAAGSTAEVTLFDLARTNGVVNGINGVLK